MGEREYTQREETAERILDAAERLFASRNPKSVSVRDVAAEAGVTHALVHHYFGAKADLLAEVIKRQQPALLKIAQEAPDIRECVDQLSPAVFNNPLYVLTMARAIMDGAPCDELPGYGTRRAMIECERRSIASGRDPMPALRDVDPRIVVAAMTALAMGWQALRGWLLEACDLDGTDREWRSAQLNRIMECIADFTFPDETTRSETIAFAPRPGCGGG